MIAAGYTMDLYCRHEDRQHPYDYFPHQFYGQTWGECKKQAQAKGWTFQQDNEVTCPLCNPRKKKVT